MGLLQFIFARKSKDSSLLQILNKVEHIRACEEFLIDEKKLPMQRSKLANALEQEMNTAGFHVESQEYRQRIAEGYWTLTRFHKNVDTGLRSYFTPGSPNFMKDARLFLDLSNAEEKLKAIAKQEREAAKGLLQDRGLWVLIPSQDRDIWPH